VPGDTPGAPGRGAPLHPLERALVRTTPGRGEVCRTVKWPVASRGAGPEHLSYAVGETGAARSGAAREGASARWFPGSSPAATASRLPLQASWRGCSTSPSLPRSGGDRRGRRPQPEGCPSLVPSRRGSVEREEGERDRGTPPAPPAGEYPCTPSDVRVGCGSGRPFSGSSPAATASRLPLLTCGVERLCGR
jgi:hypothetical protein